MARHSRQGPAPEPQLGTMWPAHGGTARFQGGGGGTFTPTNFRARTILSQMGNWGVQYSMPSAGDRRNRPSVVVAIGSNFAVDEDRHNSEVPRRSSSPPRRMAIFRTSTKNQRPASPTTARLELRGTNGGSTQEAHTRSGRRRRQFQTKTGRCSRREKVKADDAGD